MKRLVAMVMAAGAALMAVAMPTKAELQKAQEMVTDVTAADVAALKAKTKTPTEVAAKHIDLATQAGSEAEKYLLLQGAFRIYAKAGDYEGAANALGTMNREIAGMNPEVIVEIYNKAIFISMKEKAPRLHAIKEAARRQVFYRKQLAKAEAAVKTNPKDAAAQKKLGECHAELGDWPKALDAFALAGGSLAKTAKAELDGSAAPPVSGDFWWDYESGDEMSTYKFHAAELYRAALADDSFKGLARTRADQRVKEAEMSGIDLPRTVSTPVAIVAGKTLTPHCKMVNGRPAPLKFELAKGIDLELEGCPAGKFTMGYDFRHGSGWNSDGKSAPKHEVKITRPFWIGKYQVTREQFSALGFERYVDERTLMALNVMDGKGGRNCATQSSLAAAERFCGELNERFQDRLPKGYVFRLPSDAEWEYASKAGDYSASNPAMAYAAPPQHFPGCALYSEVRMEMVRKKMEWKHGRIPPGPVGMKKPNAWGMYDAVGNWYEMLLDRLPRSNEEVVRYDKKHTDVVVDLKPPRDNNDPLIYHEGDDYVCLVRHERLLKEVIAGRKDGTATFRVCLGPDLVAEKKAKK